VLSDDEADATAYHPDADELIFIKATPLVLDVNGPYQSTTAG